MRLASLGVLGMAVAMPAAAVQLVSFDGIAEPTYGGLQSPYVSFVNAETFTSAINPANCAIEAGVISEDFNSVDPAAPQGSIVLDRGSVLSRRLTPSGSSESTNCYATVNGPDIADPPNSLNPLEGMYLFSLPSDILYLGFYWGSVDIYNYFRVYNSSFTAVDIFGPDSAGTPNYGNSLTGDEVTAASGIAAPDSVFVNFVFDPADDIAFIGFGASNWAFEFDNVVVDTVVPTFSTPAAGLVAGASLAAVPAPAALPLLGLGLGLLALRRRA